MSKTLFLSDLHLGSPLFELGTICGLILSPEYERVFLVGDIFDVWEDGLTDIVRKNRTLVNAINIASKEKEVVYLIGNHDPLEEEVQQVLPQVKTCEEYEFDGGIIIHGHSFDESIIKYSWLAKFTFFFHWIFERFGINLKAFFRNLYFSISNKRNKGYYKNLVLDIEEEAIKKYQYKYKFVLMGHTHFPRHVFSTIEYINCGDWIYNRSWAWYENGKFHVEIG